MTMMELWGPGWISKDPPEDPRALLLLYASFLFVALLLGFVGLVFTWDLLAKWRHWLRFRLCVSKVRLVHEVLSRRRLHPACEFPLCPVCVRKLPRDFSDGFSFGGAKVNFYKTLLRAWSRLGCAHYQTRDSWGGEEPSSDPPGTDPRVVKFLCGHRFHTDCVRPKLVKAPPGSAAESPCNCCPLSARCRSSSWSFVGLGCPICEPREQEGSYEGGISGDELRPFLIQSLRAMYPEIITESDARRWAVSHTEIWLCEIRCPKYVSVWRRWEKDISC